MSHMAAPQTPIISIYASPGGDGRPLFQSSGAHATANESSPSSMFHVNPLPQNTSQHLLEELLRVKNDLSRKWEHLASKVDIISASTGNTPGPPRFSYSADTSSSLKAQADGGLHLVERLLQFESRLEKFDSRLQLSEDLLRLRDDNKDSVRLSNDTVVRQLQKRVSSLEELLATNQEAILSLERKCSRALKVQDEAVGAVQMALQDLARRLDVAGLDMDAKLADVRAHTAQLQRSHGVIDAAQRQSQQDYATCVTMVQDFHSFRNDVANSLNQLTVAINALAQESAQLQLQQSHIAPGADPHELAVLKQDQLRLTAVLQSLQQDVAASAAVRASAPDASDRNARSIEIMDRELRELKRRFTLMLRMWNESSEAARDAPHSNTGGGVGVERPRSARSMDADV